MGSDKKITLADSTFTPERISSFILKNLKAMAEDILKDEVKSDVITVPAYFTDEQRRATVKAGELAGVVEIPFIAEKDGKPLSLKKTITKSGFEELTRPLIESTEKPLNIALNDSGLTTDDIDVVLLVGGSTRITLVKEFLKDKLNKEPEIHFLELPKFNKLEEKNLKEDRLQRW